MSVIRHALEVRPTLPKPLARLTDLAGNLVYSWDRRVRGLFHFIDPELWAKCEHNPTVFLRRVSQQRLDELAANPSFIERYHGVLDGFDQYLAKRSEILKDEGVQADRGLVAYFCMEYGLHESLQLYSGGLGVLAGDYCKAASDLSLPFVAVGLMYRLGYFTQTIDADGQQEVHHLPVKLQDLPARAAKDTSGKEIRITVHIAGRPVKVRVWEVPVGHVRLLLLDTDLEENGEEDRSITYQLYGGNKDIRIAQEIVLGVGGVRALRALGIDPAVWHMNEGHAAFLGLERCRELVAKGMDFDVAAEIVAAATVFTTHTPVPAGHDVFTEDLVQSHLGWAAKDLHISFERLMRLGSSPIAENDFNMTALALRLSRRHNGVSRVHRGVAASMEGFIWPQVPADENPMDYVNNGVHVPTFMAREWITLLDEEHPEWRSRMTDVKFWPGTLAKVSDQSFWEIRRTLKREMLHGICANLQRQYQRNLVGRGRFEQMLQAFSDEQVDTLVLGFARRFATYKRALLLFQDPQRLLKLLQDSARPLVLLFAGKAHPQDKPAQQIIKELNRYAQSPEFAGKVFFIEGHDIAVERKLVTGVDLWLNTPFFPLEASGTSGQKAAINGVLNLSVMDGWWEEAYDGKNGWAIPGHDPALDADYRSRIEAEELIDILEREVVPLYYRRNAKGVPQEWIAMARYSMASILPRYTSERMVLDYLRRFYLPALRQDETLRKDDGIAARELSAWKGRVRKSWPQVSIRWMALPPTQISTGEKVQLAVNAKLGGLDATDVRIEAVLEDADTHGRSVVPFKSAGKQDGGAMFQLEMVPPNNGLMQLSVRIYPFNPGLAHPFEMGCMLWA
ncbi:MAG TPA: alpha-glucan family phosphorylase [Gammaproteobacteria bacterium]|jgi:starch phosphorylase